VSVQELLVPARPQLAAPRLVWVLGLGAFGLAFSITTLTFLPVELGRFTSSGTMIALILGAEGVFALLLSPVIGPWSDTFHTPLGRRRPFMLVALGPMAFCLVLMPFMPNLWTTALVVFAFFFAYYVYEPPYRGLYPDLLPPEVFGRAQGVQHVLRGLALGGALVGGGFLLDVWAPAPFLVAAFVTTIACGAVIVFVREDGGHGRVFRGFRAYLSTSWCLLREEADVRSFLAANAAWEGAFAAARIFVVLYITKGLHESPKIASLVLATVAGGYVVAAIGSGRIADRIGLGRVIFFASFVYAGGLLAGGFASEWHDWYYGLVFPVSIAGGTVMTQAWGLLFKLMPAKHRGAISGLATTTKGVGLLVGPLLAGGAIDLASPFLRATDGYQVLWPVCALPILAAIPLVARLMRIEATGAPLAVPPSGGAGSV
jgi:MFS family permease